MMIIMWLFFLPQLTPSLHRAAQKTENKGFYISSTSFSMNNLTRSKPESIFQLFLKHENTVQRHTDCQGVHKLFIPYINQLPIITEAQYTKQIEVLLNAWIQVVCLRVITFAEIMHWISESEGFLKFARETHQYSIITAFNVTVVVFIDEC